MAVVLSARLMVRYADKYDPDLAAAFEKLEEVLPAPLAEHVERTLDVLASRPTDVRFSNHVHLLTKAWAERRVVTIEYEPAALRAGCDGRGRPSCGRISSSRRSRRMPCISSAGTRLGRRVRTFKIERIRDVALTSQSFEAPDRNEVEALLSPAWDIIADQELVDVRLRFAPAVASRVTEATWHPTQRARLEPDGSLLWEATISGTIEVRLWILSWGDDVAVLAPDSLRSDVVGDP